MSKDESGGGLMSSAGLVRYFDAEDRNAIHIDPKTVVAWGVVFGVVVQMVNAFNLGGGSGTGATIMYGIVFAFVGLTIGLAAKAYTQGEV
jgi:preprotein translocase subunit Sec61beta